MFSAALDVAYPREPKIAASAEGPYPLVTAQPGAVARNGAVTLRVSGGKPLHLHAELIAEATSWTPGAPAWHEVELYQSPCGGTAVALKTCRDPSGDSDLFHARVFATLDEALGWLQAFDPTADLHPDLDASDRRLSSVVIALRAAALRQRTDRIDAQYRAMIGELLYRVDLGE